MSNMLKFFPLNSGDSWFFGRKSVFKPFFNYSTINNIILAVECQLWIQSFCVRVTLWPIKFTFVT